MSDEKRQFGSSDESSGLSRRELVTRAGLEAATMKKFKAWFGTTLLASIGLVGMSATARHADASRPPVLEPMQAVVPLDQADNDPPFGAFLGSCNSDSDCSGANTCNSFRKRGNHCTHSCESSSDCSGGPVARCTKLNRCGLNDPQKTQRTDSLPP
jgi:hypothetical protein